MHGKVKYLLHGFVEINDKYLLSMTHSKKYSSLNFSDSPFECSDRSRKWNLLTTCDLDSPKGLA